MRRVPAAATALVATLSLTACGDDRPELQVLAAASLSDVIGELGQQFGDTHDVDVLVSFGSSTALAEQAADGAPGDVLATADAEAMEIATDAGVAADPEVFATNEIVIVTPPGNPAGITTLADLAGTTWVRCADEVPCGRAARGVLDDAGVTAAPRSLEEDVRATLEKVTSGEADAALVYASDAVAAGDEVTTVPVPEADDHVNSYLVAPLAQAGDAELAARFAGLLTGPEGRAALSDAGFEVP
jgi:molybdate transport system substrate-binding protein